MSQILLSRWSVLQRHRLVPGGAALRAWLPGAAAGLACLAAAGYWGARVYATWQGLPPLPEASQGAGAAVAPAPSGAGAGLFGARPAESANLQVAVAGVIRAGDPARPGGTDAAIVAVAGQPARLVRVGRQVMPGLVLAEVGERAVVLERDGVRQQVPMPARPAVPVLPVADARPRGGDGRPALVSNVAGSAARAEGAGPAP
ncbi:hypothetical protein BKK79_37010 (plasmid) [Cupriavidus sp. USMAA2-4]|uniref:hypothetical protein n=1 Tax=Cupriavidus sp. USMAA2-4 TaxID=876364 RepID=UPI0008A66C7A|nr:hypothetical protein [Cupriavidus sp. USMAA2-4]AOY97542.1 hypothetical protein BKK79_37010 [Cupriavidus sp. USMAA2-4]